MNTKQRSIAESGIMMHTVDSLLMLVILWNLSGCAIRSELQPAVHINVVKLQQHVARQRADILSSRTLSASTMQTLSMSGLDLQPCATLSSSTCIPALAAAPGLSDEDRHSALVGLWLQQAMAAQPARSTNPATTGLQPWLETARHAWAYLFFTKHTSGERAFDERQAQVRDWYNVATTQVVTRLFQAHDDQSPTATHIGDAASTNVSRDNWHLRVRLQARLPAGERAARIAAGGTVGFPGRAQHPSPRRIRRRVGGCAAIRAPVICDALERNVLAQHDRNTQLGGRQSGATACNAGCHRQHA